jgi:hypothetical protein
MGLRPGWEQGSANPEQLLNMNQSLIRSETESFALRQLRFSFVRLEEAWKAMSVKVPLRDAGGVCV